MNSKCSSVNGSTEGTGRLRMINLWNQWLLRIDGRLGFYGILGMSCHAQNSLKFISKTNGMHKNRINITEEIFKIRSCIEILRMTSKSTQLISICSTLNKEL